MFPMVVMGQDAPLECDSNYGECGTPEMSGGGNGGTGAILINNTDLGDTYQTADDYDDDGVEDSYDNCPRIRNSEQFDSDGDSIGDLCDNCRDTHNLNQWNLDGDNLGDLCDDDDDNDSIGDRLDNCVRVFNQSQSDLDNDGLGDACDEDLDGDGEPNITDTCPTKSGEEGQFFSESVCFPDADGDEIPDYGENSDNCVGVYNPEQLDTDSDSTGDACDPDKDGDGIMNSTDNCPAVFNIAQEDADRDGIGEECDNDFCFVVYGDKENCLDPEGIPTVYSPSLSMLTGEVASLKIFTNKPSIPMTYSWSVKERVLKDSERVLNHRGTSAESSHYERKVESVSTFSPKHPGKYVLHVVAEFETGEISQKDVEVFVEGDSIEDNNSGCSVIQGNSGTILLFYGILLLSIIRRFSNRIRGE